MPAGTLVRVPPLVVHGFRNASDAEVRYLNLLRDGRPASLDSEDPPADGGRSPADASIGRGELLTDVEAITVLELSCEPGGSSPAEQLRPGRVQSLYVLAGGLVVSSRDRELRAGLGAWVQVPAGDVRSLAAAGSDAARFLSIQTWR